MKKMILLSKIIKLKLQFNIPKTKVDNISEKKKLELRVQNIFHQIDLLGFITDVDWFLNLSENRLIRYLRELIDIWEYRAQLLISMKRKICPPMGQPFTSISWSFLNETDLEVSNQWQYPMILGSIEPVLFKRFDRLKVCSGKWEYTIS